MLSDDFEEIASEDIVTDGAENVVVKSRTVAQAEASRINGAKSRGPKTAAGKAKACRNAFRHGLFACRIRPLREDFDLQHEYDLQLKGLIREFDPVTTSEWMTVETLASDMVQLGRAMEMREAEGDTELRPVTGNSMAPDYRGDVELVDRLIREAESTDLFSCPADELDWVVEHIVEEAQRLEEVQEENAGQETDGEINDDEASHRADAAIINARDFGAMTREYVAAVLRGEHPLAAERRTRWVRLLRCVRASLDWENFETEQNDERNNSGRRTRWRSSLTRSRLPTLELVERYLTKLRRSISRSIEFLERRLAARDE